jgi:hypothetical protein
MIAGPPRAGKLIASMHHVPTAADPRLEPGAVLPVQFYPARAMRSEKRLMLAILEDALGIHRKYARKPGRRHEHLAAETERWLFSDDTAWPLSFLNVCSALGIDGAWLRAQLSRSEKPAMAVPSRHRRV